MYSAARRTGPGQRFEFAGKMSDGEEEVLRPPCTPETWEALINEENQVEEKTEKEVSDLEDADKIRFRRLIPWNQIARWTKTGKSLEDIQALVLQAATYQVKSWTSSYQELHNLTAQKQ
jgi:hypothetical protein